MDKYVETLDALMKAKKEKKKKEPTIKEKEAFRSAWLGLVADTGLTGRAEQYLYEGLALMISILTSYTVIVGRRYFLFRQNPNTIMYSHH